MRPYFGLSAGTITIVSLLLGSCTDPNPGFVAVSDSAASTTGQTSASDSTTGGESGTDTGSNTNSTNATEPNTSPPPETDTSPTTGGGLCGDGNVDADEECDDGEQNGAPASGCSDSCTLTCGNGVLDIGEECDEGTQNGKPASGCSDSCTLTCGNGVLDIGEECDDDGDACSPDCWIISPDPYCGDGIVDLVLGEQCDDGNNMSYDGCSKMCKLEVSMSDCGNGTLEWGELCDDGNMNDNDQCSNSCIPADPNACPDGQDDNYYPECDSDLDPNHPLSPFRAIGLACNDGNISIPILDYYLISPDKTAWRIASQFGTGKDDNENPIYGPREGDSFLALSTGVIAPVKDGIIQEAPGSQAENDQNNNPDSNVLPPGINPAKDKSGVLADVWTIKSNPNDKILLTFDTSLPANVEGYSLDLAFLSSEWPEWVGTEFSDLLLVWQVNNNWTGTVSVLPDGNGKAILNTSSLHPHWSSTPITNDNKETFCNPPKNDGPGYSCNEAQLQGTGFEGHAGTKWLRVNHNIGEEDDRTIKLMIFLADMGDTQQASVALIDNFRYRCAPCIEMDAPEYMESCITSTPDENCCGVVMPKVGD